MKRFFSLLMMATLLSGAEPTVEVIFDRLYDFDFDRSQQLARAYSLQKASDPLGHASLAAVYLFTEMNRLQVFSKDILKEEKISGDQAKRIGEDVKREFEGALERTRQTAEVALKKNDRDANALLAMVIATGAERDFAALVEKRLKDSYYAAKSSQEYALRLQAVDGSVKDAWFTRGFSEYLVGSVPYVLRWLMKIDQVEGDKKKGVEFMEQCAKSGRYLKPFAQMMLSTIYQKEKRLKESRLMMEQFAADHPGNEVVRQELAKLPKS